MRLEVSENELELEGEGGSIVENQRENAFKVGHI